MIAAVTSRPSFGFANKISANAETGKGPPKEAPPPTPAAPRAPNGVLGQGGEQKPGHRGGTGTQGPAPGIQSPIKVEAQPRTQARNLRANYDGSIQYAAGARIDTKLTVTQSTPEPTTPLKTRAEAMRGTRVDARG